MSRFHPGDMDFVKPPGGSKKFDEKIGKFVGKLKPKILKVNKKNLERYNTIADKLSGKKPKVTDKEIKFFNDFTKVLEKVR